MLTNIRIAVLAMQHSSLGVTCVGHKNLRHAPMERRPHDIETLRVETGEALKMFV